MTIERTHKEHTITFDEESLCFYVTGAEFEGLQKSKTVFQSFIDAREAVNAAVSAKEQAEAVNDLDLRLIDYTGSSVIVDRINRRNGLLAGLEETAQKYGQKYVYPDVPGIAPLVAELNTVRMRQSELLRILEPCQIHIDRHRYSSGRVPSESLPRMLRDLSASVAKATEAAQKWIAERQTTEVAHPLSVVANQ